MLDAGSLLKQSEHLRGIVLTPVHIQELNEITPTDTPVQDLRKRANKAIKGSQRQNSFL